MTAKTAKKTSKKTAKTTRPDKDELHVKMLRETMTNYLTEAVTETVDEYFRFREVVYLEKDRISAIQTLMGVMTKKLRGKWADLAEYMAACGM